MLNLRLEAIRLRARIDAIIPDRQSVRSATGGRGRDSSVLRTGTAYSVLDTWRPRLPRNSCQAHSPEQGGYSPSWHAVCTWEELLLSLPGRRTEETRLGSAGRSSFLSRALAELLQQL